jgi:hypothetical protein
MQKFLLLKTTVGRYLTALTVEGRPGPIINQGAESTDEGQSSNHRGGGGHGRV